MNIWKKRIISFQETKSKMSKTSDIKGWLQRGINKENVKFMLVCSDDFSYERYPYYAEDKEDVIKKIQEVHSSPMNSVKEVYDYSKKLGPQVRKGKAWAVDMTKKFPGRSDTDPQK